jgi:hypothetical protein
MSNTTYTADAFKPVAPSTAAETLWTSLFMATPLYIFATALKTALLASKR